MFDPLYQAKFEPLLHFHPAANENESPGPRPPVISHRFTLGGQLDRRQRPTLNTPASCLSRCASNAMTSAQSNDNLAAVE